MPRVFHPLFLGVACTLPGIACADEFSQLPPPTMNQAEHNRYTLYLTLSVNGNTTPAVVPVAVVNNHYLVDAATLRKNHIRTTQANGPVDVTVLPQVRTEYNAAQQQLNLRVPDQWLPPQHFGDRNAADQAVPVTSRGLLLNYDSYNLRSPGGTATSTTLLEGRFFAPSGTFSQSGVWRTPLSGSDDSPTGYLRYDTRWEYNDIQRLISFQAGDFVSNALTWSHSVRMAGLRISRNFSVRPDLVTYPLLNWNGSAAVPGTVDLFLNGNKSSSQNVNAGPYTLTNVPFINGAGEATVVTTDALGRQVSTTLPFYVSNRLLAAGLSDFDVSAGALRKNYGIQSDDYGSGAFSGIYRYGLTNSLTTSVHGEAGNNLLLSGAGADFTPWQLGTFSLSASMSQSRNQQNGYQYTSGWSYYSRRWSLNFQHISTSSDYRDLSDESSMIPLSRQSDQATLSITPAGRLAGSFGLGYFSIRAADNTRTQLANFSWSHSVGRNASLSLSLNKNISSNSLTGALQLTIPWGTDATVNAASELSDGHHISNRLGYTSAAPVSGGLGWTVAHSFGGDNYNQANLTWLNRYSTVSGGFYGSQGNGNQWLEVSGSIVAMDNDLFLSRRINDAFIVADTHGYPGTEVSYENRLAGVTDKRGHLLIPWVSAWYPGKLTINALNLPADTEITSPEHRVAVREGSGAVVSFRIERIRSAILTFTDEHHQPLPVGTEITELNSGQTSVIGYDGQAWLSHLGRKNHIRVTAPAADCDYRFSLPQETKVPVAIGPIICHLSPPTEQHNDH